MLALAREEGAQITCEYKHIAMRSAKGRFAKAGCANDRSAKDSCVEVELAKLHLLMC